MKFTEFASQRFSVRKFKNEHLPKEIIDKIILGGHIAPTGCNYQPQRILVVNSDEGMDKIKKCTNSHFDAPCAMIIGYNKNESWVRRYDGAKSAPVDSIIVATHMMLASHAEGVGSCMVMSYDPEAIRKEFCIPDEIETTLLLMLGYPHEDATPHEFHSKFRPQSEVVFYEKFI